MSIDVPVESSGAEGIDKIVSAIDRMHASMERLGSIGGLSKLERQMKEMQASMTTGFAEIAAKAKAGGDAVTAVHEGLSKKLLSIEQRRDVELNNMRQKAHVEYVKSWEKNLSALEKAMQSELAERSKAYSSQASLQQKRDMEMLNEAQNAMRRLKEIQQRRDMEEHREAQAQAQSIIDIARRRDVELHSMRQKAAQDAAAAAEKQRMLNANFSVASPASQLSSAKLAQAYMAQPGASAGAAGERFGSAAMNADIRALQAAHDRLTPSVNGSRESIHAHNAAMREGHALARGLAGSLGGLWLTYGSLVPLAAGAAIAGSLKAITEQGREIEYQLKFVEALSGSKVGLDSLLKITDQTIVSVKEAAEGMRALAQNGIGAADSFRVLPTILNLAVIGEMSVAQAALAVTGAISAFGLALDDADHVANVFAQTAATSNTSVLAMTESMKQASTVASIYGATLEEAAGVIGVLAKSNITGGAAGTAYTNMLTGLYAPTQQAKRAMAELGVTTDDGAGGLKTQTVLMGELRGAMAKYNDTARATLAADIFTVRGAKAWDGVSKNWDQYIAKVEDAKGVTNFMGRAVATLEDTTTGSFARMRNSISSSLAQAFEKSAPALQQLTYHLAEVARSEGAVKTLTAIAQAALRLASTIVDNAEAIGTLVAGFVALRVVSGVTNMVVAYTTATVAATAATTAGGAAAMAAAARFRMVVSSLGWIGLAVAGAVTAWQLFVEKTTDVESAATRQQNTIDTTIEFLVRETAALKERNRVRDEKPAETTVGDAVKNAEQALSAKRRELSNLRSEQMVTGKPSSLKLAVGGGLLVRAGEAMGIEDRFDDKKFVVQVQLQNKINAALAEEKKLRDSVSQARVLAPALKEGLEEEKFLTDRLKVQSKLEELAKRGRQYDITSPEFRPEFTANADFVKKASEASEVAKKLQFGVIDIRQANIELARLTKETSATLAGRNSTTPDSQNDALNAQLKKAQLETEIQRMVTQENIATARAQNSRGELGDLGLINVEMKEKLDLANKELVVAQHKEALAGAAGKLSKAQGFENDETRAQKRLGAIPREADQARQSMFKAMAEEERKFAADTMRDKGLYAEAYLSDFEAQYGKTMDNLERDILASDDETHIARLQKYQDFLEAMGEAGLTAAKGKQAQQGFDLGSNNLDRDMAQINQRSAGGGLSDFYTAALAAEKAYESALPNLIAKQKELQAVAQESGKPADIDAANKAMAELEGRATQMRNIWVSMGQEISDALTNAFGSAGTAAGGVVNAMISLNAKRKQIESDRAKESKDPASAAKAQEDAIKRTASAELTAYGKMAGAAKNLFKEKTAMYKALDAIEKASHVMQIAMTLKEMYTKLTATAVVTTASVTGSAQSAGAATAGAATEISAKLATAQAGAVGAVVNQGGGDPYTAFGRIAAMAAIMAALGFAVSGGGGSAPPSSVQRQETQGSGSVFGDTGAKSDSIRKSLEQLEENTDMALEYSSGMLASLRNIESAMGGVANLVVRGGLTGTAGSTTSLNGGAVGSLAASTSKLFGGIGPMGAIMGSLAKSILGSSTTAITDAGLQFGGSVNDLQAGKGYSQYTDTKTDSKALFGLIKSSSSSTQVTGLNSELTSQFSLIFTEVEKTLAQAAVGLGLTAEQVKASLDSLIINASISLKDLKGDALVDAINAVVSKATDEMALAAIPGLDKFRQVGEGYLQTVVRVANGVEVAKAGLERLGMIMIGLPDVGNKQGDIGAELVRETILRYQVAGTALTGVGDIMKTLGGSAAELLEVYQELLDTQVAMRMVGLDSAQLGRPTIKGAGSLSNLQDGLESYFDGFFTKTEQAAAKTAALGEKFAALGVPMPKTIAGFRDLVTSIPQTTAAGQELLGSVLGLAEGFLDLKDAQEALSPQDLVDAYYQAGKNVQSSLRSVGDAVKALADKVVSTTAATASARDAISSAYFSAQDKVASAQEKVNQLLAESYKNLTTFGESIGAFLLNLDADKVGPSRSRALRLQLSGELNDGMGGDKKAQDAAMKSADLLIKSLRAGTGSSLVAAQGEAQVRSALMNNQASIKARPKLEEADPMKVALKELETAQKEMLLIAGAAAASGANTDRSTFETSNSAEKLLQAFLKAESEETAARANYATALQLTSNLALTAENGLTNLIDTMKALSENQTKFDEAKNDLAEYVIDIETESGMLNTFIDNLILSLGLTGDSAKELRAALSNPATAATTLASLMGNGSVLNRSINTFGIDLGRLTGTEGVISKVVEAMAGTGLAAEQLAELIGEGGMQASINMMIQQFGLVGIAAQALIANFSGTPYEPGSAFPTPGLTDTESAVARVYQAVLQRSADTSGLAYWAAAVDNGVVKLVDLASTIARSAADDSLDPSGRGAGWTVESAARDVNSATEWLRKNKVPGYAAGGMFGGGVRLVGENGPEVEATGAARYWNAEQMSGAFRTSNSAAEVNPMIAELARMTSMMAAFRREMAEQAKENRETAKATRELADAFRRATTEKNGKRGFTVFEGA